MSLLDIRLTPVETERTPQHRQLAPWWSHNRYAIAAVVLLSVVNCLNLAGYPGYADDEGTYYSQALAVLQGNDLAPYTYWYDHPPIGWVLFAPLLWIANLFGPGDTTLVAARAVMVLYSAATAALLYVVARRLHIGVGWSVGAILLWGLSPLTMMFSRQVYLDNMALPWLLAAFALALNARRDVLLYIGAGLCFGVSVLTKETLLLTAPALLYAFWRRSHLQTRMFGLVGLGFSLAAVVGVYPLLAATRSELFPGPDHVSLWEGIIWQLGSRAGSGALWDPTSLANGVFTTWTRADWTLLVLGLAATAVCAFVPRLRVVALALVVPVLMGIRPGGYLPNMYVVGMLPFFALAIVGVLEIVGARIADQRIRLAAVGVLAIALAASWSDGWRIAMTADDNAVYAESLAYIEDELPADSVIICNNVYWNDLVAAGRNGDGWHGPVWFPKYDLDSESFTELPGRAEDVDYLVVDPLLSRNLAEGQDGVRDLLENSTTIASFGSRNDRVEIREVDHGDGN